MIQTQKVVVVGGGPVGALAALYAARRGYETELYELRDDPNHGDPSLRPDFAVIPLALSERGIKAIAGAQVPGLLDEILANSRPIYTRMVHARDTAGEHQEIPMKYGPQGECLHTLQREKITKHCLLALEKEPTAKLFFNQKMVKCDFENSVVTFESVVWKEKSRTSEQDLADDVVGRKPDPVAQPTEDLDGMPSVPTNTSRTKSMEFDLLIGADGTYSSVRQSMMRELEVDFSQFYVNALWCDFIFPADESGNYPMSSKCLHVWPADENIVMAQPDFNGSFRAGMVCSTERVRHLEAHPEEFAAFFSREFPGIVPDLLSAEEATAQFVAHQKIPLKSVKLNKFGYKDNALLVGDSSHTMTPFHAMGMITGLEDVRVFFEQFRDPAAARVRAAHPETADAKGLPPLCPEGTVAAYTEHRVPDVHDMIDLAHVHYDELRHGVRSPVGRMRKKFDAFLARWVPALDWTTLYARIQFGNERFSVVRRKEARQTTIIKGLLAGAVAVATGASVVGTASLWKIWTFDA